MQNEREEKLAFLMEGMIARVRIGFTDLETMIVDVEEQVADEGWEADFSEEWIRDTITQLFNERMTASKNWQHPTETERLIVAFDKMRSAKIIALHCAGYTQSDSLQEVAAVAALLKDQGLQHVGHCFYHEQDVERVIYAGDNELFLGFYSAGQDDEPSALWVGHKIKEILEQEGFTVAWNGALDQRIAIKNFTWQNQYSNDNNLEDWNGERVIDLIRKAH